MYLNLRDMFRDDIELLLRITPHVLQYCDELLQLKEVAHVLYTSSCYNISLIHKLTKLLGGISILTTENHISSGWCHPQR